MNELCLRDFLRNRFSGYRDNLRADESLDDIVDSLGLFELVSFVEEAFHVSIPTAQFAPARFSSIGSILELVDELRPAASAR